MVIKHNDLDIPKDDPFKFCKLDRRKYANVLTAIVESFASGFVLAINNEWGTGKTTFVKMWKQDLENKKFTTIYFNAWENDFEKNPLAGIMSELKTLRKRKNDKTFKSLLQKGAILTKNILPAAVKGLANKYLDNSEFVEGLVSSAEAATEILENEIDQYAARKRSLADFRIDLERFLQTTGSDKPVVFIIDELDRCRPNYAVEILEQMKHFFAVNGMIFVLAIDKIQLGHAIRGVYGSEQLNAEEYLRRFIDLEYSIPEPETKQFVNYLFDYYAFDQFFRSNQRLAYPKASEDRETFLSLAIALFDKEKPTLRQQEKIFAHARMALKTFTFNNYLFPSVYVSLVLWRTVHNDFYKSINERKLSLQDLADRFSEVILAGRIGVAAPNSFLYLLAQLTNLYNNYLYDYAAPDLVEVDKMGKNITQIKSKIDQSVNGYSLADALDNARSDPDRGSVSLGHLLKKIDLLDPIVS